jgi:hypothetical protein
MNTTTLLISLLCAFGGYRFSVRSALLRGSTPWRMPSIVWGIICLTGPLGLLIELVAVRTTKAPPIPANIGNVIGETAWSSATSYAIGDTPVVTDSGHAAANDGSGKTALFGWYPDPSGRHERRYWDGKGWTSLIEDNLVTAEDPLY